MTLFMQAWKLLNSRMKKKACKMVIYQETSNHHVLIHVSNIGIFVICGG